MFPAMTRESARQQVQQARHENNHILFPPHSLHVPLFPRGPSLNSMNDNVNSATASGAELAPMQPPVLAIVPLDLT